MDQITTDLAERLLKEGVLPLMAAARAAGLHGNVCPSLKTFMRAAISRKLEAVKVGGRWLTSPNAIVRWVHRSQARRDAIGGSIDSESANRILSAYGLGRPKEMDAVIAKENR